MNRKMTRILIVVFTLALLAAVADVVFVETAAADSRPSVQLRVENAVPRDVDDPVQKAIIRDYAAAWQAIANTLADNNAGALNDSFIGFALDQLTQRVHDQSHAGLHTRIVDHGHKVEAVFYSLDGSAIELRDHATLETQILEGGAVLHSERTESVYYVVMTGAEDRWKVRVLESAPE